MPHWKQLILFHINIIYPKETSESIEYSPEFTLEFLISIGLRLLILEVFFHDLRSYLRQLHYYLGVYVYCFSQFFPGSTLIWGPTLIRNSRVVSGARTNKQTITEPPDPLHKWVRCNCCHVNFAPRDHVSLISLYQCKKEDNFFLINK